VIPPLSLGALTEAEGRGEGSLSYFLLQASSLTVIQNSDADRSMPLRSEDKSAGNLTNAQRLRRESSPAERVLWGSLRARRLGGFKFRRQVAIGPWVADFYCPDAHLIVELDGASHSGDRKELDARRDQWMRERDLAVFRVTASEFTKNTEGVLRTILHICRRQTSAQEPRSDGEE